MATNTAELKLEGEPLSFPIRWWHVTACDRCYFREMLLPLALGLLVIMLVLAGNFVYWAINSIINHGMPLVEVIRLFILAMPGFGVQGIPAGVILAVCLVLSRAVRDNEVLALRVGGCSLVRVAAPLLLFSLLAAVADYVLVERIAPGTNQAAEKLLMQLMARQAAPLMEGDRYFRAGNYYFYVESVRQGVLRNVMIYERGSGNYAALSPTVFPVVLLARSARQDPKKSQTWILQQVVQHIYDTSGSQVAEAHMDRVRVNIPGNLATYWAPEKQPFSMTGNELGAKIKDLSRAAFDQGTLREWQVDLYRRVALPGACFVLALLAIPLTLHFARQGSFAGLVLAFLLAFLWQGCDGWFRALGIAGYLDPRVAAHATNALFGCAGVVLLGRLK